MYKFSTLLLFSFLSLVVYGQTIDAVHISDRLLKAGTFNAAITIYDFPKNIKELQDKALKNLKRNPQWADKYIVVQVQKGLTDIPKFLDAYGLTEEEFDKMLQGFKAKKHAFFSDTTVLIIKKVNGIITFHSSKNIALFNYLKIDTKKNVITLDNFRTTTELSITGKFYATILQGIETNGSEEITSLKNQTGITNFGLTIGVNLGDNRPTLCLFYGKGKVDDEKILCITIL